MKPGYVLFSAVQFVFASMVIVLGFFFSGLHYAIPLRMEIASFFSGTTTSFALIGFVIFCCGVLLLLGCYWMNKGVYYRVKMGKRGHCIDPEILRGYVADYWKGALPDFDFSTAIRVSCGQKIEIYVELPSLSGADQKALLEKAELELSRILHQYIGYEKPFFLNVLIRS